MVAQSNKNPTVPSYDMHIETFMQEFTQSNSIIHKNLYNNCSIKHDYNVMQMKLKWGNFNSEHK